MVHVPAEHEKRRSLTARPGRRDLGRAARTAPPYGPSRRAGAPAPGRRCPCDAGRSASSSRWPIAVASAGESPRGTTRPVTPCFDHLRQTSGVARHDGHLASHRLGGGNPEALLERRDHRDRGRAVVGGQLGVGHPAQEGRRRRRSQSRSASFISSGRSKPSPASTSLRSGNRGLSWATASMRNRIPLRGKSWRHAKTICGPYRGSVAVAALGGTEPAEVGAVEHQPDRVRRGARPERVLTAVVGDGRQRPACRASSAATVGRTTASENRSPAPGSRRRPRRAS